MQITLRTSEMKITPTNTRLVEVTLEDIEEADIVQQFGIDRLLDQIGKQAAIEHFDIEEAES